MTAKPVKVAFLADTADLRSNLDRASAQFKDFGSDAEASGAKASAALDGTADGADQVASKGSQAAGALSGLGDLVGGKFGSAMAVGGIGLQAFADAGDLVNAAIEGGGKLMGKAVGAVKSLGRAETYAAGAKKASAAAQVILNAVMSANPVLLIVTGLLLLAGSLVLAYKKSETFRKIVDKAFAVVKGVASDVVGFFTTKVPAAFSKVTSVASGTWSWIKGHWPLLLAILTGPFGLAVLFVTKNFDKIVGFVKGMPGRIKGAATGMFDGISDAFASSINWVIDKWNGLSFSLPSIDTHIPGVGRIGGFTLSTPDIPHLAKGGIVFGPTIALVGEAGPEAVIPLRYLKNQGRTVNYNVRVEAPVGTDPYSVGETIVGFIREYEAGGGN